MSDSCAFISSPEMALISSTMSFLFLLVRTKPPRTAEASTGASAKDSFSFCSRVVWSWAGRVVLAAPSAVAGVWGKECL